MGYNGYVKVHNNYIAKYATDDRAKLDPGHYRIAYQPDADRFIFQEMKFNHDALLELPSLEFQTVASQIDRFLTSDTKKLFKDYGFLYKRSVLLHGVPGTGKTCLVNRISNKVVQDGGVVLFNPNPELLSKAYDILADIQPETNVVVVFEELDQMVKHYEGDLLNLLDGEVQRENVIYLATTNYIEKIPARILRPGRFSSVVEVKYPDQASRAFYLNHKMGELSSQEEIKEWTVKTDGLSIDELKEVVLSTKCLEIQFDEVLARIRKTKEIVAAEKSTIGYDDDIPDEYNATIGRRENEKLNESIRGDKK